MIKYICVGLLSALLTACSGFFDKDNTPKPSHLVDFTPEIKIQTQWNTRTGSGVQKEYLKLVPAVTSEHIFTADKNGNITATHKSSGKTLWSVRSGVQNSGGPAASETSVVIASHQGDIVALNPSDAHFLWKTHVASEVLAAPAIRKGIVIIKAMDGKLSALSEQDGHLLWQYQQTEPALILRGSSAPQIQHDMVVAGFANGNVAKLTLQGGNLQWQSTIAIPEGSFAIQRMIDIDADPLIFEHGVYAATYQGHIAALDLLTGQEKWSHDLSSYTGMAIQNDMIVVSDAKSHLWMFDRQTGKVNWKQTQLESRGITGPAFMGHFVVVGDAKGYLHWFDLSDGHLAARIRMNKSALLVPPVVENNILYVFSSDGHLAAYTIG